MQERLNARIFGVAMLAMLLLLSNVCVSAIEGESRNTPEELIERFRAAQAKGSQQLEQDEQVLRELVKQNPSAHKVHALLAQSCSTKRDFECAVTEMEEAVKLAPQESTYWHYLGGQYCATGQPGKAAAAYEKALENAQQRDSRDRAEIALSVRRANLLKSLIDPSRIKGAQLGDKPFDATWARHNTGFGRLDFPNHSSDELAAMKQQLSALIKDVEGSVSFIQEGQLLRGADSQAEYLGCAYDRWFVVGMHQEGKKQEGCFLRQAVVISGEILDDGTIQGKELMETTTDQPEKCPKAVGTAETLFTAAKSKKTSH